MPLFAIGFNYNLKQYDADDAGQLFDCSFSVNSNLVLKNCKHKNHLKNYQFSEKKRILL